jgi:hypothetical protein
MGFVHAGTRLGVAKEEASATLGADRGFRDSPRFARQHGSRLIANLKPVAVFPRWERAYDLALLAQIQSAHRLLAPFHMGKYRRPIRPVFTGSLRAGQELGSLSRACTAFLDRGPSNPPPGTRQPRIAEHDPQIVLIARRS